MNSVIRGSGQITLKAVALKSKTNQTKEKTLFRQPTLSNSPVWIAFTAVTVFSSRSYTKPAVLL